MADQSTAEQGPMEKAFQDWMNKEIAGSLKELNSKIQAGIRNAGLDPLGNVYSDNFDIVVGGVTLATASYSLGNLRGLSSVEINKIEISKLHLDFKANNYSGEVNMLAQLAKPITIDVSGSVKVPILPKATLAGGASVNDITFITGGNAEGSENNNKEYCLDHINLTNFSPKIGSITVHLNLAKLDVPLGPLEAEIRKVMDELLQRYLGKNILGLVNEAINASLPQCTKL